METECSNCGDDCSVDAITGRCHNCGSKQQPAVVEIRDDGTIIYEGGQ